MENNLGTILCLGGEYCGAAIGALAGNKEGIVVGLIRGTVSAVAVAVIDSLFGAAVDSIRCRINIAGANRC